VPSLALTGFSTEAISVSKTTLFADEEVMVTPNNEGTDFRIIDTVAVTVPEAEAAGAAEEANA